MQNTTIFLVCCVIAASHSFFLTSKDVRKILQYFPKAFDPETKSAPVHYRRRENDYHYHQQHSYRPEYISDFYDRNDRNDHGEKSRNMARHPKAGKTSESSDYNRAYNDKTHATHYHSHEDCDHPEHHRPQYSEDRMEKRPHSRTEEANTYYQNAKKEYKKKLSELEKDYEGKKIESNMHEKPAKSNNNKKDYITGVLVSIPKIKNDEDVEGYYKNARHQNVFLHHLLKTEDEDEQPSRHPVGQDDEKAYLY